MEALALSRSVGFITLGPPIKLASSPPHQQRLVEQPPLPPPTAKRQQPRPRPPQGQWLSQYAQSQEPPTNPAAESALVEMGFALADASEALYRSGNDIAAAAALLADRAATTHSRF